MYRGVPCRIRYFLDGLACRIRLLENGRDKQEQDTQMLDFLEERATGTSRAENRL